MDDRTYTHLVRRLEVESSISPSAFRTKVVLISVTAYLALFGMLACTAALLYLGFTSAREHHSTANTIRIALAAFAILPVFFIVLRLFFMRLTAPQGRFITRQESPRLFDTLDKMRSNLRGPQIHHVLIDDQYNAGIMQVPRLGLFGGHINYLILGLPYMLGTAPREMLATIAHEYGHLCGNHGKLGAWVYRQRRVFGALHERVQASAEDNAFDGLLNTALTRFMPYYNAYTFVLSRQNEYEADRTATELVGATANASGLVRDTLLGRWIHHEFWPRLFRQADTAMKPAFMPFHSMKTAFKAAYDQWATKEALKAAWMQKSDLHDTHPCLRDRVEATGESPVLPAPPDISAADALLGARFSKTLIDEFDSEWWSKHRGEWEARCKYATRSRSRLKELAAKPLQQLPVQDLQEYAFLTAEFDSDAAAKPILEHLLKQPSGPFPRASFTYGRILLSEDNRRGLDYLEEAAKHDRQAIEDVAHIGFYYLLRKEGEYAAEKWWDKIWELLED
jgi:hypothetical protein